MSKNDRVKEAIRYLGYGRNEVDEGTLNLINRAFEELGKVADKRIVYRTFPISLREVNTIIIDNSLKIESKSLSKTLKGCKELLMLGATLGTGVDRVMKRASISEMSYAVVLQASAAALLEEYLDEWQVSMKENLNKRGLYIRPRFSPGYGDVPLTIQGQVLAMLEAQKKIGLTMTDNGLLAPLKSVTAFIGVSDIEVSCHRQGCEICEKVDCKYRRC
jgi:hypothetical protein